MLLFIAGVILMNNGFFWAGMCLAAAGAFGIVE